MRFRDWITLSPLFFRSIGKLPARHLFYLGRQLRNENPQRHNGRLYINSFFPPYPSKAFDKFFDAVLNKKRIPYSTYFAVTPDCPYKCPHCSYGGRGKTRLDTKQVLDVIRQIKSLGTTIIGFTGGEPLLRTDIAELVKEASSECATVIFTTGHNLNKALALKLKEAGLDCIMIGIESPNRDEHDRIRGVSGSFNEAVCAIQMARQANLYTAISTIGTKEKILSGQIELLAQLAQRMSVMEFRILEPVATGGSWGKDNVFLDGQQSQRLCDFHKKWNRKKKKPAVAAFSYLESKEMFGCGAGYHHLFIDSSGEVCPCDLTPLSFGNCLTENLESIWTEMGQVFNQPRTSCFMKSLCRDKSCLKENKLPLEKEKSVSLCQQFAASKELPKIYANYFKGREK